MATATKTTVHRLPLTKARTNLGSVIRRIRLTKDHFILEKDGIPVAAMMDVDEYEDYIELHDPELKKQIAEGYRAYTRGNVRPAGDFIDELKRELNHKNKSKSKKS
jgi:PHD/YefM family antitoxin component YafN of YafNO toxin-antitoxin module